MAKTQVSYKNIANRVLTGASLHPSLKIYDETANYSVGAIVSFQGDKYIANSSVTGGPEGDMSNSPDISTKWDKLSPPIYSVYPSSQDTINNTKVTISFDTVRYESISGAFSINAGELTANVSGVFLLSVTVSFDNSTTSRNTITSNIQLDTGSGYSDIPNLALLNYTRTSTDGRDTSSITIPIELSTGDKLRVQAVSRIAQDMYTVPDGCSITLFPILSVSGPKGDVGPAGPSGDLHWMGNYDSSTSYVQYDTVY